MKSTVIALALSLGLNATPTGQIASNVNNTLSEFDVLNTNTEQLSTFDMLAPTSFKNSDKTQLEVAKAYAPMTKYKFKATDTNEITNVEDETDVIEVSTDVELGKEYTVTFKGEQLYSIK
ncbi:hypothetical protein [Mammaliicoccus sciuri]|uniref:hypothetical protein n=1 Tax=Mammaliicoccus sciuri TaxID=1296 RepID=UPI0021CEFB59|nr:hypothetical protein [Mammaliicoccus sciuri]UXU70127.1 hypothetical protein MUA36_05460 [Mammaliicoccus sciuri]WQL34248.1 hypothetical protein P3U41_05625 [Mammaliicoccus sciuri]WQL61187.1 hypothetical protein P3T96_05625 [Mammaliicoccus sciuri]